MPDITPAATSTMYPIRNTVKSTPSPPPIPPVMTPARARLEVISAGATWMDAVDWICGCALIYGALFGVGKLMLGEIGLGIGLLAMGAAGGAVIWLDLSRRGWGAVSQ